MKHVGELLRRYRLLVLIIIVLGLLRTVLIFPQQLLPAHVQTVSLTIWTIRGVDDAALPGKWDTKLSLEQGLALTEIISSSILVRDPFLAAGRAVELNNKYYMVWIDEWEDSRIVFNIYSDDTVAIWIGDKTVMCRPLFPIGKKLHQLIGETADSYRTD